MWNKITDIEDRFLSLSDLGFLVNINKGFLYKKIIRGNTLYDFNGRFNKEIFDSDDILPGYEIIIQNGSLLTKDIIKSFSIISVFTREMSKVMSDLNMEIYTHPIRNTSSTTSTILGVFYNQSAHDVMSSSFFLGEERFNWKHTKSVIYDLTQWRITFKNLMINVDNNFRFISFFISGENKHISEQESTIINELKESYEVIESDPETLDGFFINPNAIPPDSKLGNGKSSQWSISYINYNVERKFYKIKL